MKIKQMTFQKIVVLGSLILCACTFFYTLIFSTPFYSLTYTKDAIVDISALYYDMQPINKMMSTFSLIYVLLGIALLIYFNQSRRIYYITNYISTIVFVAFGAFFSVYCLSNIFDALARFNAIDFEETYRIFMKYVERYPTYSPPVLSETTITLYIGIVLYITIAIFLLLLVVNLIAKTVCMRRERTMYAEEDAEIRARQLAVEVELLREAQGTSLVKEEQQ